MLFSPFLHILVQFFGTICVSCFNFKKNVNCIVPFLVKRRHINLFGGAGKWGISSHHYNTFFKSLFLLNFCLLIFDLKLNDICRGPTWHRPSSGTGTSLKGIMTHNIRRSYKMFQCLRTQKKNPDTFLPHHENFCRPTRRGISHQDGITSRQSVCSTPTVTSPETIRPLRSIPSGAV
jgi:hypothetical protein